MWLCSRWLGLSRLTVTPAHRPVDTVVGRTTLMVYVAMVLLRFGVRALPERADVCELVSARAET